MSVKLFKILKNMQRTSGVSPAIREYEDRFRNAKRGGLENRRSDYKQFTNLYYDLVTDFYEYGWGRSFHFAPRVPGESFKASLARHEHYLAHMLGLRPGMVVADLGCGVGGSLLEIARFSGAKVVGVNSNAYQLERARELTEEAGLTHLAEYMHCDFLHVDAPDESFDAVYAIEATCCAPDKLSVYGEAFRLLKPGACFGVYEFCLTDRFNAEDPLHLKIKADIELGGGLLEIDDRQTIDSALQSVGIPGVGNTRSFSTSRSVNSLVSTSDWHRSFCGRLSQLKDRTLGHPQFAESARGRSTLHRKERFAYRRP